MTSIALDDAENCSNIGARDHSAVISSITMCSDTALLTVVNS